MSQDLELGRFDGNESSVTENDTMVGCESLEIFELLTSPKTIFKLITAIVIIFANTVLISIILRSTKFRRQRFHKFIVSLAFADLLIGVTIPFMTLTAKEHTWHLGPSLCQVRTIMQLLEGSKSINQSSLQCTPQVFTSLQKVSLAVSTYHFLGVSLDRFFAIKMPMAYRQSPQLNLNQCFQVLSPCSHSKAEVLVEIIKFIFGL